MTFNFSGSLLRFVGYRRQLAYDAKTLGIALESLFADYPDLRGLLMDQDLSFRRTMRLAINSEVIRNDSSDRGYISRPLAPDDSVEIMTAISGG
jgi:molybdopterin synthase sulfur carrier subunit